MKRSMFKKAIHSERNRMLYRSPGEKLTTSRRKYFSVIGQNKTLSAAM